MPILPSMTFLQCQEGRPHMPILEAWGFPEAFSPWSQQPEDPQAPCRWAALLSMHSEHLSQWAPWGCYHCIYWICLSPMRFLREWWRRRRRPLGLWPLSRTLPVNKSRHLLEKRQPVLKEQFLVFLKKKNTWRMHPPRPIPSKNWWKQRAATKGLMVHGLCEAPMDSPITTEWTTIPTSNTCNRHLHIIMIMNKGRGEGRGERERERERFNTYHCYDSVSLKVTAQLISLVCGFFRHSEGMVMSVAMDVQRRRSMNSRALSVVPMVDGHGEGIHHESAHGRYHGDEGREGEFVPWIIRQTVGLQALNGVWKYVHEASGENNSGSKGLDNRE